MVVVVIIVVLLLLMVTSLLLVLRLLLLALIAALLVLRLLLALVAAAALLVAVLLLISTAVVRLLVPVIRMVSMIALSELLRHLRGSTLEVDVYSAGVGFGRVLQTEFLAYLLDAWFDLLDVVWGVVPFTDDAAESCLGVFHSRFGGVMRVRSTYTCR